ncbi:MAG: hypothetical protein RQ833_06460 [Sphingomonadaceae bacterium]|nr:hypothetical protein [Sphingomonadaceae bacterium]
MSEVDALAAEAAETRARIRTQMEELQQRLDPQRIVNEVRAKAADAGAAAIERASQVVSDNAWIVPVTGLVAALLAARALAGVFGGGPAGDEDEYAAYGEGDSYVGDRDGVLSARVPRGVRQLRGGGSGASERLSAAGDRLRAGLDSARGTVGSAADDVANRASEFADGAAEKLREWRESVGEAASRAGSAARDGVRQVGGAATDNPGAVIAAGLVTGAVLGWLTIGRDRDELDW